MALISFLFRFLLFNDALLFRINAGLLKFNQSINKFIKSTQQTCMPQEMSKTTLMLLKQTVINKEFS